MGLSNYRHLFCHFCNSPMDDEDNNYACVDCAIEDDERALWWDDEREWYVLKDDEVANKYIKD